MADKRHGDLLVTADKKLTKRFKQETAAAKVGVSVRSARRIEGAEALPSQGQGRG